MNHLCDTFELRMDEIWNMFYSVTAPASAFCDVTVVMLDAWIYKLIDIFTMWKMLVDKC